LHLWGKVTKKSNEMQILRKKMQFVRRENKIVRHENMLLNEIL